MNSNPNISAFLAEIEADIPKDFTTDIVDDALADTVLCIELVNSNVTYSEDKTVEYVKKPPKEKISFSDPVHIPGEGDVFPKHAAVMVTGVIG